MTDTNLKVNGNMQTEDFLAQGFHKLDDNLVTNRPPKIKWGLQYLARSDADKVKYLEKLAASMNHAAHLIQEERNQLNDLCFKKEEQIGSLKTALDQNNSMIQQQIGQMNEERQKYNKAAADLMAKVRELEGGNIS